MTLQSRLPGRHAWASGYNSDRCAHGRLSSSSSSPRSPFDRGTRSSHSNKRIHIRRNPLKRVIPQAPAAEWGPDNQLAVRKRSQFRCRRVSKILVKSIANKVRSLASTDRPCVYY
jgi:hypothetical protein